MCLGTVGDLRSGLLLLVLVRWGGTTLLDLLRLEGMERRTQKTFFVHLKMLLLGESRFNPRVLARILSSDFPVLVGFSFVYLISLPLIYDLFHRG